MQNIIQQYYPTLFAAPKMGGLLQSSGFLDLNSLLALSQTAKAHAIDEISLILFIENEISRYHRVSTLKEAITYCKQVCEQPLLKQWLQRDTVSIIPEAASILEAGAYEVMLAKMLQAVPKSQRWPVVSMVNWCNDTVLHRAARVGNAEAIKLILALYPKSQRLQAVSMVDWYKNTVLHRAARSGNAEAIELILALYPEAQRLQAVSMQNQYKDSVLHCAAYSGSAEAIRFLLALYPEAQRLQAASMQNEDRDTVLHYAAYSGNAEAIKLILALYPEAQRWQAVTQKSGNSFLKIIIGRSAWNIANEETRKVMIELLPKRKSIWGRFFTSAASEHMLGEEQSHSAKHTGQTDSEQPEAIGQRPNETRSFCVIS